MKYDKYSIKERIESLWKGKFIVTETLEDYVYTSVHGKIKVKCLKCGHEYDKRINDLLHGYGCNHCANLTRRNNEELKELVNEITNREYTLVSSHSRTRDIATFRHNSDNCKNKDRIFTMKIHNFITLGQRCPFCNSNSLGLRESKGIKKIKKLLNEHSIPYDSETKFKGCKKPTTGHHLPFDIYLEELNTVIEYDGIQHFKSIEYFGGDKRFNETRLNDSIKDDFCKENKINIIRIPYNKTNDIEKILINGGIF